MTNPSPPGAPPAAEPAAAPPPPGQPGTEPPALTAFAWRHRLVRPVQGRHLAGVSGALARATDTDPVLWRVVLVVLTFFGGIGIVIYLLGWLLLPADGDTASPVEALAGRGRSRTSNVRTIIGLVIVGIALAGYFSDPFGAAPLLALLILGGVLLLLLRDRGRGAPAAGSAPAAPAGQPAPPFAPRGPFVLPPPGWTPPETPGGAPVPPPVPPAKPRSRLGGLTISVSVLALGGLFAADLAGYSMPGLAYLATPLAVLGVGLVVGTWLGRARWLIPFGIALCLAIGGGYAALQNGRWDRTTFGELNIAPATVAEIDETYHRNFGDITLDLSDVDFSGQTVTIDARVDFGSLQIKVGPEVDVTVEAAAGFGDAAVFGESWSGAGNEPRTIVDLGPDGAGGGRLTLDASVGMGSLEIDR